MVKYLFCAGGTGGHIYPALTLAEKFKEAGHEVTFIGARSRMENKVIPERGYPFIALDIRNYNGFLIGKLQGIFSFVSNYLKCLKLVEEYDVVVGFGNYISLPVVLAAKQRKKKTVIHEQNSFPGKANRVLDQRVDLVIGSYKENLDYFKNPHTEILGNPQSSVNTIEKSDYFHKMGLDEELPKVLMFFGSLGSETVDKVVHKMLDEHDKLPFNLLYASGESYIHNYDGFRKDNVKVVNRVEGSLALADTDLLISRAGATTICEISALGVASILIPSPYVTNNHQYYNALSLVNIDAAKVIEEKNLTPELLYKTIIDCLSDTKTLETMKKQAKTLGNPKACEKIAERIMSL